MRYITPPLPTVQRIEALCSPFPLLPPRERAIRALCDTAAALANTVAALSRIARALALVL